jgi:Kelch motif
LASARVTRDGLLVALVSALVGTLMSTGACSSSSPAASTRDAASDEGSGMPRRDAAAEAAKDQGTEGALANGTLGSWQTLSPMPIPRANHCAVAANGYLVVLGGNSEPDGSSMFVNTDAVNVAALNADGSLGPWSQAGTTPSPVDSCTVAANGSTIILVDGIYDDMSKMGTSFSAELSASGKLGTWTSLGPLPNGQDVFYSDAWVASDSASTLLAMSAESDSVTVLAAPLSPSFGPWSAEAFVPTFLGHPQYAFTGTYVYALGGYGGADAGNPVLTTVTGAAVDPNGKLGTAFATQALPTPTTFGEAIAVDGWIFVVGGGTEVFAGALDSTVSAPWETNGELGAWKPQSILPQARRDFALTLAGDFLYLTGGGDMGPGVATVFAARVRF